MKRLLRCFPLVVAISLLASPRAGAQIIDEVFGKNRIQYHDDFDSWFRYESENFLTYWYGKSRNVAHAAVQFAELDFKEIHNTLEHRIDDRIELIVYTDPTDLKQSNIGLGEFFLPQTAGQTRVFENKVFICFKGDHNELRRQVREGIAEVYINALLFGSNLQEIVQNAVQASLPDWYKAGMISYIGSEWDPDFERRFKEQFLNPKKSYQDFEKLARDFPDLAGHSLWYYIAQTYGPSSISNLLYITRINRSLDNSFFYVLGVSYEQIIRDWKYYYKKKYLGARRVDSPDRSTVLSLKRRGRIPVQQVELSPDGQRLAFVQNDNGRYFIYLQEDRSARRKLLFKKGVRNLVQEKDDNYPILAWSPDGQRLSIVYERRDIIYLREYDLKKGDYQEQKMAPQLERVYDIAYFDDNTYILSADEMGLGNLYRYYPRTRQFDVLISDFFDDLDVEVGTYQGVKGVYFSSNRPSPKVYENRIDTILPLGLFDIYFLDMENEDAELKQVTSTAELSERSPELDGEHLFFMEIGRDMQVRAVLDTGEPRSRNYYQEYPNAVVGFSRSGGQVVRILDIDGRSHLLWDRDGEPTGGFMMTPEEGAKNEIVPEAPKPREKVRLKLRPSDKVRFQSKFGDYAEEIMEQPETLIQPEPTILAVEAGKEIKAPHTFNPIRAVPYRLSFRLDDVSVDLDNRPIFQGLTIYQDDQTISSGQNSFSGFQQGITPPPMGILFKGSIKDLFEDYIMEGGARFPTSFNGSEYFLTLHNRKGRLDKSYSVYRRVIKDTEETGFFTTIRKNYTTLLGQVELRYPLDIYTSLRGTFTLRNDLFSYSITDLTTLELPDVNEQRAGVRLEYVFDNTIDLGINMMQGTRYKVFAEMVKRFQLELRDPITLRFNKGFLTILGVDFRHYEKILGRSIFASRFAAATSFGSEQVLFQMGGINNWLFPNFNGQIPYPNSDKFAYQQLAQQMRGFGLNIRNGSSFAVMNNELRIPVFQYLSKGKIRMSFFRNFQLTGFLDVGTAWLGLSPFDKKNPLNTLTLSNPAVELEVNFFRDPIVVGYGFGARTTVFGYFVRADYGWGIDTKVVGDPIFYLSIGTDF